MNKNIFVVLLVLILAVVTMFTIRTISKGIAKPVSNGVSNNSSPNNSTGIANPASVYCEQQGGKLNIITGPQGGQIGICVFVNGVECDEWKFFRGECSKEAPTANPTVDIFADMKLIEQALVEKDGIDLNKMEVKVTENTGTYAAGFITPRDAGAGGGYFFAAKTAAGWKIVASGNGTISCDSLKPYPDFPKDMILECVDPVTGNPVQR